MSLTRKHHFKYSQIQQNTSGFQKRIDGSTSAKYSGGLLDHMGSSKFHENVYVTVRDAAIATWEGIKESVSRMINMEQNMVVN